MDNIRGIGFFIPILIVLIMAILSAVSAALSAQKNKSRNNTYQHNSYDYNENDSDNDYEYEEGRYNRDVHSFHKGNPEEEYARRADQLKNLYNSGMMDIDEYKERRAMLNEDFKNHTII